jgi:hypothetical protein
MSLENKIAGGSPAASEWIELSKKEGVSKPVAVAAAAVNNPAAPVRGVVNANAGGAVNAPEAASVEVDEVVNKDAAPVQEAVSGKVSGVVKAPEAVSVGVDDEVVNKDAAPVQEAVSGKVSGVVKAPEAASVEVDEVVNKDAAPVQEAVSGKASGVVKAPEAVSVEVDEVVNKDAAPVQKAVDEKVFGIVKSSETVSVAVDEVVNKDAAEAQGGSAPADVAGGAGKEKPLLEDMPSSEVYVDIPGVEMVKKAPEQDVASKEAHEPQVHFVVEWDDLFRQPSFKKAIKDVLWFKSVYKSTKYADTIRETSSYAKSIAENFGNGKLSLGNCERKLDNLWGDEAEVIKDIMVRAFQVDRSCEATLRSVSDLLSENKNSTLSIVGAPGYFEIKAAEGNRCMSKLFFNNKQVKFKLAKDHRASDTNSLFKKALKDMNLTAEDKVIYLGDGNHGLDRYKTPAETNTVSLKFSAGGVASEIKKQLSAVAEDKALKMMPKDTYCIVEWKDLFADRGGMLAKQNSKIIGEFFKDKGLIPYKDAKSFYKSQILGNKDKIEKILYKTQIGGMSSGKCVRELKKLLDLNPKAIKDKEFAKIMLKVHELSNEHINAIKELDKIVSQNEHFKLLVVGAPNCFEKMVVEKDSDFKAIISKKSAFEYTLGTEQHTNNIKELIDAALAKQDIAEDDHIIQFGDDFGDQVCASFIKTHGFNDLFNLLKEVDNSVLEENKQYADVEPQPVEHGDASSSKGFFSSISNWWHGVVDSF